MFSSACLCACVCYSVPPSASSFGVKKLKGYNEGPSGWRNKRAERSLLSCNFVVFSADFSDILTFFSSCCSILLHLCGLL